jgi:hypothetical protein
MRIDEILGRLLMTARLAVFPKAEIEVGPRRFIEAAGT